MSSEYSDKAFLTIIETNKGLIYKVARSYCKEEEDRKDLIQEIILQLWKSFGRYDQQYKLSTWIYRIALNVAISYYRSEKRRRVASAEIHQEGILQYQETEEPDNNIQLLMQFISELKELDRAIMLLHLEAKDHNEISEILGLSVTNVSTKIYRIKKQLATKFEKIKTQNHE